MNEIPRPELARTLRLFPATNIVIANMIGAGIFTTSGLLIEQLGSPVVMIVLWIVGGILALCGALCYGELGAAMPEAGGEYLYLSKLFHPLLGFLSGWISFFVGFSAPLAATSLGFSEYVASAFPRMATWGDPVAVRRGLALLVIVTLTLVHLRGVAFGALVQNYLTMGKVLLLAGLIAVGFVAGGGEVGHFTDGPDFRLDAGGWRTVGLSLMWIMFGYSGWNAASYIGSEISQPRRNVPLSLVAGTAVVMLLYLGLNALYVFALSPSEMSGVIAVGAASAARLFGPGAETVISMLIAFALLSSISALIILGPRVYYAMARDGNFFSIVGDVHPRFLVPHKSILLQCLIAAIMVLSGSFEQILTYMGFCLGIFPILAVMGLFRLRLSGGQAYRSPAFPVPALVFACTGVLILVLAFAERPVESSVALATVALGIPAYFAFRTRQKKSAMTA